MISLDERLKLYLVLESSMLQLPLEEFLHQVCDAGIKIIQLRDKKAHVFTRLVTAYRMRDILKKYDCHLIINDSFEIALQVEADGVHLGVNDDNIEFVRKKAPDLMIGYSCNTLFDCYKANEYADYAGVGPFTNTSTKEDIRKILGVDGTIINVDYLKIPSVAIGGINPSNVCEALSTGVSGIAVSSFICSSQNPYKDTKKLLDFINERI